MKKIQPKNVPSSSSIARRVSERYGLSTAVIAVLPMIIATMKERKAKCAISRRAAAMREWHQEAGLSWSWLRSQQGVRLAEAGISCRYLVGRCLPPDSTSTEPDAVDTVWEPPEEDPHGLVPTIQCRWSPVVDALEGLDNLGRERRNLLRRAMTLLAALLRQVRLALVGRGPSTESRPGIPGSRITLASLGNPTP